ncbi:type II toxin-antitoxin system toxin DNA ADP-ribosyl transferase DarT [Gordonia asplenii]|uniref:type II toxin-antitoxin system toxin DNA ADP-ribosyl transferase DarT n=1 Tax=Gordonia asplenii TaxID=2725283 RepID=UPI0028A91A8C|nr:DUF4433 domain-containing protein [Gordonia asplenii]
MPRPVPTTVCHFTHIDHLATIVEHGLLSDTDAQGGGHLTVEAGNPSIKEQRRRRPVVVEPYGIVADYAPFYFRSRSPMMYAIRHGNVPTFTGDCHDLIYLITTIEILHQHGLPMVFTDRNAALAHSKHSTAIDDLDDLVDWAVMYLDYWRNTEEDPDRKERRMAECLVHQRVPWDAIDGIAVYDDARRDTVESVLANLEVTAPPIHVTPKAYF